MKKSSVIFSVLICIMLLTGLFISCSKSTPITTTSKPATTTAAPATTTAVPATTTAPPKTTTATTTTAPTPKAGGIIRFISNEQPSALGIPDLVKTQGYQYVIPMFETLVRRDTVNGKITFVGLLAESWEWSSDYTSITFHLRKGVKFHDGTNFDANAVKWNIQQRIDAKQSRAANVKSVDVIDDYTVRFNLVAYSSLFLSDLEDGNGFGWMASPTAYQTNGRDKTIWYPVGTGPFKFKSWQQDVSLEMVRNDDYWGGKALLDGIKWIFISDALTAELSFSNGDAERIYLVGKGNELAKFFQPKGYNIVFNDSGNNDFLIPSSKITTSPWAKKEVRQALDYAIDREQICKVIGNGFWTPQYSMHVYSEPPNFQARKTDPAKAKQLMASAGYSSGFNTLLWQGTNFAGPATAVIQSNLADIGIKMAINPITPPKWIELDQGPVGWGDGLLWSGGGPAGVKDWSTFTNYMFINMYSGGGRWNVTMDRPADIEAMCKAFLGITDEAQALPAAQKIDAAEFDYAEYIPLWVSKDCTVLTPTVKDYKKGISPYWNFTGCWINK
jgi:peptide/nickel transport system substrate-binding protein